MTMPSSSVIPVQGISGHVLATRVYTHSDQPAATIFFSAPFGTSSAVFRPVIDELSGLHESCRILGYDRAGIGLSGTPLDDRTVADMVADEVAVVSRLVDPDGTLILVGSGLGGLLVRLTSLNLCEAGRPVSALVLVEPTNEHIDRVAVRKRLLRNRLQSSVSRMTERLGFGDGLYSKVAPRYLPYRDLQIESFSAKTLGLESRGFESDLEKVARYQTSMPLVPTTIVVPEQIAGLYEQLELADATVVASAFEGYLHLRDPRGVARAIAESVSVAVGAA